jgi:hypothetical protein
MRRMFAKMRSGWGRCRQVDLSGQRYKAAFY